MLDLALVGSEWQFRIQAQASNWQNKLVVTSTLFVQQDAMSPFEDTNKVPTYADHFEELPLLCARRFGAFIAFYLVWINGTELSSLQGLWTFVGLCIGFLSQGSPTRRDGAVQGRVSQPVLIALLDSPTNQAFTLWFVLSNACNPYTHLPVLVCITSPPIGVVYIFIIIVLSQQLNMYIFIIIIILVIIVLIFYLIYIKIIFFLC